jgi:hypothetical protein
MPLAVDVFWSFRSPYSYLATPRLVRLATEYDVDVTVRVVLPIAWDCDACLGGAYGFSKAILRAPFVRVIP